jgi:hypothetical protein
MILRNCFLFIGVVFIGTSCSKKLNAYTGTDAFSSETGVPNYGDVRFWAAHPAKWDPSDTIPLPLLSDNKEKAADVFFLHPTTLTGARENGVTNAKIDDPVINYKTDYSAIMYQASAFNERARVFAPRYRQAHIGMYAEPDSVSKYAAFNLAYEDVKNAFQYYLEHENKGRPIIIASHSQGTTHATRLLKEFFDNKPLSKQLVCAYLVGMGVKKNEYQSIPVCQDGNSTGCFVSWRTFRYDYSDSWANRIDTSIAVVNPITWKTTTEVADKTLQQGAVLYNLKRVYTQTQSAQVEGSALWVSHPRFPGSFLYRNKNFHAGDINLFYVDVRKDVSRKIDAFLQKQN